MTNFHVSIPTADVADVADYTDIRVMTDRVIAADGAESLAWLALADACERSADPVAAWSAARDHYVTTFPTGKRGRATRPADTFKARKADVMKVRKAHPRMTADAIIAAYGSVRSAASAIRTAERTAAAAAAEPVAAAAEPTAAERLAAVSAAVRLAVAAGLSADDIAAAVAAGSAV